MNAPFATWLTARLLALSTLATPPAQRAWADAMRAEFHYLPAGAKLRWSIGCLVAAIKLRFAPMNTGTFRISRWVMLVEVLGCFLPALLAWWEFTFGPSGAVRLNAEIIEKYFLGSPGGAYILGLMIGFAVTGLVGPIGLFFGLRYVMLGRGLETRAVGITMIAALVLQSLAGAIGAFWMGTDGWGTGLQLFVLVTLLPIAGVLHLMYLAKPAASLPTDARLAAS